MIESNNGQNSARAFTQRKPKRHTGKFIDGRKRQAIITALANGESLRSIARRLNVSVNTVMAISEQNWQQVETRKERIAAQSERNATRAAELIAEKLEHQDVPLNVLVPVFGVSVDKALALRGDASLTINLAHQHQHIHAHITPQSLDEILAHLPSRNDPPQLPQQGIHAPEDIASE
jgi:Homeodomain-like domain